MQQEHLLPSKLLHAKPRKGRCVSAPPGSTAPTLVCPSVLNNQSFMSKQQQPFAFWSASTLARSHHWVQAKGWGSSV